MAIYCNYDFAPHPKTEYWIYKSNTPYPKGKVTFFGIEAVRPVDPITMWTFFIEAGQLVVEPALKLTTTWGVLKAKGR